MLKKIFAVGLLMLLVIGMLGGCTLPGGAPAEQAGGTLRIGSLQEPDTLNPLLAEMLAAAEVSRMLYSGLFRGNDRMELLPDLAETVPTEANGGLVLDGNGFTVTYKLRQDVKWHDGEPFDADDVRFTYETYMNPQVMVPSRDGYDKIEKLTVVDPYTVQITFSEIYPAYNQLFGFILPEHLLSNTDLNTAAFNRNPVGTGPFRFVAWEPGSHIELAAFTDYYGDGPYLDSIIYRIVPDTNTLLTLLQAGEIDLYQKFEWPQLGPIEKMDGVTAHVTPSLLWEHLDFNLEKPLFQDKNVRQAIFFAINRREIIDMLMYGRVAVATGDQSPLSWAYNPDVRLYAKDNERARQLLEASGWQPGADGFYAKDGQPLRFTLASTAGSRQREQVEQLLKEQLKEAGIDLEIQNYDPMTLFGDIRENGKFDTIMFAWQSGVDPDNYSLWHSGQCPPDGQNYPHFRNARVDELLDLSRQTFAQAQRKQHFDEIQSIIAEEVPIIPLYYWANLDAVSDELQGFKPNPTDYTNLWNCNEWWLNR